MDARNGDALDEPRYNRVTQDHRYKSFNFLNPEATDRGACFTRKDEDLSSQQLYRRFASLARRGLKRTGEMSRLGCKPP